MTRAHLASADLEPWTLHAGRSAFFSLILALPFSAHAEPILPTTEGATWEYELTGATPRGAALPSIIVRMAGQAQASGKAVQKLETRTDGVLTKTEFVTVDNRGVLCHRRDSAGGKSTIFAPPQTLVPAALKKGVTWEMDDDVAGASMHQKFRVLGEREVIVPAGTFRAFHLQCEQPWPISITIDRWFALGVGFVKDVTTTRGPTGRLLSRSASVLKNFQETSRLQEEIPSVSIVPEAVASPAPADTSAPQLAPAPLVSGPDAAPAPRINLEVAGERDGEPQTEFKSDAPNIYVRWTGDDLPPDAIIRVAWVAEDVGDLADPNFIVDETETVAAAPQSSARFTLSRPEDGWASGKYRVELYANDELRQTVSVTIVD